MRISVLMGGNSPERDISLASGRAVGEALRACGHEVTTVDLPSIGAVLGMDEIRNAEVVFPALHGGDGEDGHLQGYLDLLGVPYALSGQAASAVAMDKALTKRVLRGAGISTPDWFLVSCDGMGGRRGSLADLGHEGDRDCRLSIDHVRERADAELGFPLVIKPNAAGSSVAIEICAGIAEFDEAFARVATHGGEVLLEKYIPGRELTSAIFLGRRLPLVEIRTAQGFYDYANKYTDGASEYLVPAPVHSPLYERISDDALRIHDVLDCRGMVRVDFRLDNDDYFCLEVNTIPGLTATSLVPMAAAAVGIEFGALVEDLCRQALAAGRPRNGTADNS